MNIDYQISMLSGSDPLGAITALGKACASDARPAMTALMALARGGEPAVAINALQLALIIGPGSEADFVSLLEHLLQKKPRGYLLALIADLLEQYGPLYGDQIELIAKGLAYPHYRIRLAAVRALAAMADLLEIIEPQIHKGLLDKSCLVTDALVQLLVDNEKLLPPELKAVVPRQMPDGFSQEQIGIADQLEGLLWKKRVLALNSTGEDDDDVVLVLHHLSESERQYGFSRQADILADGHGLGEISDRLIATEPQQLPCLLNTMMTPLYGQAIYDSQTIDNISRQFLKVFNQDVQIFMLAPDSMVLTGVGENGLVISDGIDMGLFWVADMD